jgi:DNA-binding HxlR family transcriptional regulator
VHDATHYTDAVERKSFEHMHCSVAQCLELVGEWWTMLVIRDAFRGVKRFDAFQSRLGIARNILTQRLNKLVAAGILTKQPYQEHPPRYEYLLTDKGRDLWPLLTAMRQWGDRHAAPKGPPLIFAHAGCGAVSELVLTCSHCNERVTQRDMQLQSPVPAGPKAKPTRSSGSRAASRTRSRP